MGNILENETEINNRVYNRPMSTIMENDKKINYYNFISSVKNDDCNKALIRIVPKIDMKAIENEIDNMPIISSIRKIFYKELLNRRYEVILKQSYNKL